MMGAALGDSEHPSTTRYAAGVTLAGRLAASDRAPCRWVGRDALRDLSRPMVRAKLARRDG